MTTQDTRTAVEDAIKKAVPEISGGHVWGVGYPDCQKCGQRRFVREEIYTARIVDEKSGGSIGDVTVTEYDHSDFPCPNNPRRPITLEDVLRATKDKLPSGSWVTATEYHCFHDAKTDDELCTWHLGKPLSDQSDEVIEFLFNILCVNVS